MSTFDQILYAIDDAALLAAESSIDAHGYGAPPECAWDFLVEQIYEETGWPPHLPRFLTRKFKRDYWRHVRLLQAQLGFAATRSAPSRVG